MFLYRLAKEKYIRDLSGTGARMHGGRWNNTGAAALYTSAHLSLAILEFLVHTSIHALPPNLSILTLSIPDSFQPDVVPIDELPNNWRTYPAPGSLAERGTDWLLSRKNPLLKVPSVIVPQEWNIIVNPLHSNFDKVEIESVSSFDLDSRFLK
ncbi:MAG: RES family NAD+ phosphorylase [Balneolaceae bacterium]|nr:RES family NAD+ phosphorylase [Balneolaceae bacterium]